MLTDGHIQLLLQIDTGTDPIQGRLSCDADHVREFRGWLGLAAAIEELTRPGGRTPTPIAFPSED